MRKSEPDPNAAPEPSFPDCFAALFEDQLPRLSRFVQRLSGDPALAADIVQEAFVRLYERGTLPAAPEAWLITVALNLLRNERSTRARRLRLLSPAQHERVLADPPLSPEEAAGAEEARRHVRRALEQIPERDRALLLLQAEGYRYGEIAAALELQEASIGVFLARARRAFRRVYEEMRDAR
jgi:RNA polymerase sigma-70 factor (ECF subfamily)